MLAEFAALQERVAGYEEIKSSRVNFFLIVVAAFVAGLPSVFAQFPTLLPQIIASSSVGLLLLGLITLDQIVDYSISIVVFHQRAGRIRRWYVNHDSTIRPFVPFKPGDDQPPLVIDFAALVFRGGDAIVLFVNCITLAISVVALLANQLPIFSWQSLVIMLACVVAGWYLQKLGIRAKLVRADRRMRSEILFPYEEPLEAVETIRRGKK